MKKRRRNQLSVLLDGRVARLGLGVLLAGTLGVSAEGQTEAFQSSAVPRDSNRELRSKTWSVYAEGGLSWATGVWYPSLDAKRSYKQSPAVGGGVDFTLCPWVRIGAEYIWSRYRREQRLSSLDQSTMPIKAYGNYAVNYHNAKLGVGFNLMELWSTRGAQWLNVWVGSGVGYMMARGTEYTLAFSNTQTQDGTTSPLTAGTSISNESTVLITGNVQTNNRHEKFERIYVPASVHVEADVSRQVTLGLKGELDWVLSRKELAPKHLVFAMATLRYNFVPSRASVLRRHYEGELRLLNAELNALREQSEEDRLRAERLEKEKGALEGANSELSKKLSDCESSKPQVSTDRISHFVQFDHNSSYISREEGDRLRLFAQGVQGRKLRLVAEASTPGSKSYNQQLSERRLKRVISALISEGISEGSLSPRTAVGEENGISTSAGRRVTITAE